MLDFARGNACGKHGKLQGMRSVYAVSSFEKHISPEKTTCSKTGFQSTKSMGGEQVLLLDCATKALIKEAVVCRRWYWPCATAGYRNKKQNSNTWDTRGSKPPAIRCEVRRDSRRGTAPLAEPSAAARQ